MDPYELAESELRDLVARRLLERGLVKQFYVMLTEIIKRILEARYAIQTAEKTTSEIITALQDGSGRPAKLQDLRRIESLLAACDLVKFAKYIPSKTEHEDAVESAFEILSICSKQAAPQSAATETLAGGGA